MSRHTAISEWLGSLGYVHFTLAPASADASFRSYWRVTCADGSTYIVMDAPPQQEPLTPFLMIARALWQMGLHVPQIFAEDHQLGFLLLSDLGSRHYLSALVQPQTPDETPEQLYGAAITALITLQQRGREVVEPLLPPYSAALLAREMALFSDWFIAQQLQLTLTVAEHELLATLYQQLIDSALAQPQVVVHRDYHSRNLMVTSPNPGVIDFQDAVVGPVTYDLVSLLRDCYISWPLSQQQRWITDYLTQARAAGLLLEVSDHTFFQWFSRMGMQRHLKAIGIFSRLNIRDKKPGYLNDIPRTFNYLTSALSADPAFSCYTPLFARIAEAISRQPPFSHLMTDVNGEASL
ncbi:MAG: phosphotransferase [Gammaproteobacteria bacterium]|nr:phosphotransferase [Gammaproteobacteria bacterium]